MTIRKNNLIISLIVLLFADIVYFIWMPYPKSFLKTVGSSTFVFDFITNIIFFAVYAVILLVSINSITKPGNKLSKKKIFASIAVVVGVQLGLDVIKLIAEQLLRWWSPLSNDFFTVLGMFLLVFVVRKMLKVKSINWKRFFAIFVPFAVISLTVFFVLDVQGIQAVIEASEKYTYLPSNSGSMSVLDYLEPSSVLKDITMNVQFLYEIRNAFLDILTGIVIMMALYFSVIPEDIKNGEEYHTKKAYLFSRIVALLLLSFVVCGFKVLVLPQKSLNKMSMPMLYENGRGFNRNEFEFIVWRTAGGFSKKEKVCHITHYSLKYEDKKILGFTLDGEPPSLKKDHMEGNQIVLDEDRGKIEVNGTEVIICYDKAFAYLKDGIPCVVTTENISDQEYDEILVEICEKMLSAGRVEFFEYICEYLMKYNREIAEPYVQRYANKNFTLEEIESMGNISSEYISKIAQGNLK